jgi:hypothetical protein
MVQADAWRQAMLLHLGGNNSKKYSHPIYFLK